MFFFQEQYELHVFPHCTFSIEYLTRLIPGDWPRLQDSAYLLFVLTTTTPLEPSPEILLGDQQPNGRRNGREESPDHQNESNQQPHGILQLPPDYERVSQEILSLEALFDFWRE